MRKIIQANGTFYYPEENVNLIDTDEVKIIVENPAGYVEGDSVRLFYSTVNEEDDRVIGVNTFEMFSPLVKNGTILRAIFYIPLSAEFVNDGASFSEHVDFYIKTKGSTDFSESSSVLSRDSSVFFLTQDYGGALSHPIPVFFFSERGAGLFENRILNRQLRVADTNFSSVAIRQDKFNPLVMDIGGRNHMPNSSLRGMGHNLSGLLIRVNDPDGVMLTRSDTTSPSRHFCSSYFVSDFALGDQITLSAWIRLESGIFPTVNSSMFVRFFNSSGDGVQDVINIHISNISGDWVRVTGTGTITHSAIDFSRNIQVTIAIPAPTAPVTIQTRDWKLELGNRATDWTPAPEDYEVTEVVTGADLAGGLAKFDASYAFKLLDDSEWVTKKLICPEDYIQLFWGEPRSETRFSFWFKIKEIEKSSEAWGDVEHYRELRAGTDVKEMRKEVTKYRFPKTKLRLSSGVFRQDIIDKLKGIAHSPTIYKYNPYTKLNEGAGVVAQVTELRTSNNGIPTEQVGAGHFKLKNEVSNFSNTLEELINSPESVFDLEFSFKGQISFILFAQNRDAPSKVKTISSYITETNFVKKTFNGSITIDRSKKVEPALMFIPPSGALTEIKDIHIKGSLGGIEDVDVEIATMNIIPRQDGESEMELTVISDDFRKPNYLYF